MKYVGLVVAALGASGLAAHSRTSGLAPTILQCVVDSNVRVHRTPTTVTFRYLGAAGFLIETGARPLLTGPFFSNPGFVSVRPLFFPPAVHSDTALIDTTLPKSADSASTILVGHGHYDHLMDIPYVARAHAESAMIYGGPSVANMLNGDKALSGRVCPIRDTSVGRVEKMGTWIRSGDGAFRFMALRADHAPTRRILGFDYLYADGTITQPMERLPRAAHDWKVGEPYSYLIDVLDANGRPVFRIYYQDTANMPPWGFPPRDSIPVDVAILVVANAHLVSPPTPDSILSYLKPRYVIGAHWEDFFNRWSAHPDTSGASKMPAFETSLERHVGKNWSIATPLRPLPFPVVARRAE